MLNFIVESPNLLSKTEQNEMFFEGKRLHGSNFDHLIRNVNIGNGNYNLTGVSDLPHRLAQAKLSPSAISKAKFKAFESPGNSASFQSPLKSAPTSPTTSVTLNPLAGPRHQKHGCLQSAPPHQI